jgi:hypothetical protein
MRTAVRFEADFPKPKSGESGAGEVASMLIAGLRGNGFSPSPAQDEEYAHSFVCPSGKYSYSVMVAFDFVDNATWEVSCPPALGRFAKLRGQSEEKEHSALVSAIASVLSADPRIRNVRWYKSYGDKSDQSPQP